ncbi:MAG: MotA/TolQ/ExbB proton channel family protein [Candidatus Marinimicrobia bacterium]|nr:MotA/TolQ/ExbB proton channel family protein [Candidatus Neomarinimicrobiota bacterium]
MNILFNSVYDIGIVGRLIVLTLIALSIIAWGIIIEKIVIFSRSRRESAKFFTLFQTYSDWRNIEKETRQFRHSPFLNLFRKIFADTKNEAFSRPPFEENEDNEKQVTPISYYKSLADSVISTEMMQYEKRLVFLSSTVSASPFLGLFGTVWGVMQAFMSIGIKGSAAITAIGPGIAEALITTVAGLAVAIPVLFAYNLIVDKIRKYENQMQILANDMIKKIVRENIHGGSQI